MAAETNAKVDVLMGYLAQNIEQRLTLSRASRDLGMSASTIQRLLKARDGRSFIQSLSLLRLERIMQLLVLEPDLKAEALALLVGWRSRKSLYVSIYRLTGGSLAGIRRQARESAAGCRPPTVPRRL